MNDLDFLNEDGFDASEQPEDLGGGFDPIPKGVYRVIIEAADVESFSNDNGSGKSVKLKARVIGPSHANRVIFPSMCVQHSKPKSHEYGRKLLQSLCEATGHKKAPPTSEFIGREVDVDLYVKKGKANPKGGNYPDSNEVSRFIKAGGEVVPDQSYDDDDIDF